MQNLKDTISTIIVSIGGTTTIILAISSFIGKIWANKYAEKHRALFEKDIEKYKSEINAKINKLDKLEEKALYISKVNYDNEYKIYMEIWPKLIACINNTLQLYPQGLVNVPTNKDELEKYKEKKYNNFISTYNKFVSSIDKYAPFYEEEFYNDLNTIKKLCFNISDKYKMYEFDVKYNASFVGCRDLEISSEELKEIYNKENKIIELKQNLLMKIRTYLNSLKLEGKI